MVGKILILALAFAGVLALRSEPAVCSTCLPTFCGASSECPPGCFCAIPLGEATGHCSGTR